MPANLYCTAFVADQGDYCTSPATHYVEERPQHPQLRGHLARRHYCAAHRPPGAVLLPQQAQEQPEYVDAGGQAAGSFAELEAGADLGLDPGDTFEPAVQAPVPPTPPAPVAAVPPASRTRPTTRPAPAAEPSVTPAGETGRVLGSGPRLELPDGTVWRLSPATWGVQEDYELWLEQQAQRRLKKRRQRAIDDDDGEALAELAEELRDFRMRRDAGAFAWRSQTFAYSLSGGGAGLPYLLFLLLRKHHPDVSEEEARELFQTDRAAATEAVLTAIGDDPNSRPPAAGESR